MIWTISNILLIAIASVVAGVMLLVISGVYQPVFDRFLALGVLCLCLTAIHHGFTRLMGDE